jgi:hypothetical protein
MGDIRKRSKSCSAIERRKQQRRRHALEGKRSVDVPRRRHAKRQS